MIEHTKLDFYCGVLAILSLICLEDIAVAEWRNKYNAAYYNLISFPNLMIMDETLISDETEAVSVISCSLFCGKKSSVSLYYNDSENKCYCNSDIDPRLILDNQTEDVSDELMYGYIVSSLYVSTNISTVKYDIQPYKEDCFALYHHGYKTNGIYAVQPVGGTVHDISCDMDSFHGIGADDCLHWLQVGYKEDGVYNIRLSNGTTVKAWCNQTGGGWTVIQHRQDGTVDFYQPWSEYVNGFGDAKGEYWLGLEAIYLLAQNPSSLRIDMETFGDVTPVTAYALYDQFSLTSATDKYRLSIGAFNGSCEDSLRSIHDEQQFSTWDSDNDSHRNINCALNNKGGWWYNTCHISNLNGIYHGGFYEGPFSNGMTWSACWTFRYSVKTTTMRIKRI